MGEYMVERELPAKSLSYVVGKLGGWMSERRPVSCLASRSPTWLVGKGADG